MCTEMHMTDQSGHTIEPGDDCEIATLHPRQVMAARVRLADAPPAEELARLFSILADPTRARLLTALTSGELCVCDLAAATGVNRTTVSHQLRMLRDNRVVRRRREGKVIYYALDDEHISALLTMGFAHVDELRNPELDRSTA
jgi:ArsR family transcriptional regulator, lead/cadmium/zinc/bismuth-responsive transcriptional repressor